MSADLDPVLRSRLIEEGARGILRYWKFPAVLAPDAETVLLTEGSEVCRLAAAVVDALGIEEGGALIDGVPYTPEDMAAHLPLAVPPGTDVTSWFRIRAAEDPLA